MVLRLEYTDSPWVLLILEGTPGKAKKFNIRMELAILISTRFVARRSHERMLVDHLLRRC